MSKIRIVMCGSALENGGGVVAVTKNYLNYESWDNVQIEYVVTHVNGSKIKKVGTFIRAYVYIFFLLVNGKVDIFHLHVCDGGPFYRKSIILFTAKVFKKKVILHHHTDYTVFFKSLSGLKKKLVKQALRKADLNIVLGNNLTHVVLDFEPTAKVTVLYNAVSQKNDYEYNLDSDTILFLGWIIERKGVFDLLQAIKTIDCDLPSNIKVALCGYVDEETLRRIHSIGIDNRISHIGWIEGEEKESILKRTIVNVLPSYREGLPMTILETMAKGIPNIASDISTIPEVIENGKDGLLIEPGNIKEIAEAIKRVVLDAEFREGLSFNSYNVIKNKFEVNKHIDGLKKIYKRVLEENC